MTSEKPELTIAGNITLGRMRELTVKTLGSVISDNHLHVIQSKLKPSRKQLRKLLKSPVKKHYSNSSAAHSFSQAIEQVFGNKKTSNRGVSRLPIQGKVDWTATTDIRMFI